MKRMAAYCRKHCGQCADQDYIDLLIEELESRCTLIECAHADDEFTGEIEDFEEITIEEAA